jgi:hypothetical protein
MRKCLLLLLLCSAAATASVRPYGNQPHVWILGGAQAGGFVGSGKAGNTFDKGAGVHLDFGVEFFKGWSWVMYGFSTTSTGNRVRDHRIGGRNTVPYFTEIRKASDHGTFRHFTGYGVAWNRLHLAGTEGSDNQAWITFALGVQKLLPPKKEIRGGWTMLEALVRPYIVTGNAMGQNWGFEARVSVGRASR